MTTSQAARFLGIAPTSVLRQVRAGRIPAMRHEVPAGVQYTYLQSDLEFYRANPLPPGRKPRQ